MGPIFCCSSIKIVISLAKPNPDSIVILSLSVKDKIVLEVPSGNITFFPTSCMFSAV